MLDEIENDEVENNVSRTGEQARFDAKLKNTYVVYRDSEGDIVKEYPDGRIVKASRGARKNK